MLPIQVTHLVIILNSASTNLLALQTEIGASQERVQAVVGEGNSLLQDERCSTRDDTVRSCKLQYIGIHLDSRPQWLEQ